MLLLVSNATMPRVCRVDLVNSHLGLTSINIFPIFPFLQVPSSQRPTTIVIPLVCDRDHHHQSINQSSIAYRIHNFSSLKSIQAQAYSSANMQPAFTNTNMPIKATSRAVERTKAMGRYDFIAPSIDQYSGSHIYRPYSEY